MAAVPGEHVFAVDLLERYPTKLTGGHSSGVPASRWEFTSIDIYRVSRFDLEFGRVLKLSIGPADVGIGHGGDGAVWALLIPREGGRLTSLAATNEEAITNVWLRFHPRDIDRLFPHPAVFSDSDTNLFAEMRAIANHKFRGSWHAGNDAMIPDPTEGTVDVDTQDGIRRFFAADNEAHTAEYIPAFQRQAFKPPPAFSPALAEAAFDELWKAFDQKYAMFVLRHEVDWSALRDQYRPEALASKSTREFASVCAEMLKPLRDLHVWLTLAGQEVPVFDRVRSDARFIKMLRRFGFPTMTSSASN